MTGTQQFIGGVHFDFTNCEQLSVGSQLTYYAFIWNDTEMYVWGGGMQTTLEILGQMVRWAQGSSFLRDMGRPSLVSLLSHGRVCAPSRIRAAVSTRLICKSLESG